MKTLTDTLHLFQRELRSTLRSPIWAFITLFQPFCYLFLFAPLLDGISKVPGFPPGGVFNVFTPGLLVMMCIFGTAFTGFGLVNELRTGVIERFRVTPVSRLALLLGRALRDMLLLLLQCTILVLVSLPLGLHLHLIGVAVAFVLLALLGLALSACSYALALALKDENALSSMLNFLSLPLLLLSGITLPLTLAPPPIRAIANVNPFAYAVNAARILFAGHLTDPAVLQSFLLTFGLTILALWWGDRAFSRAMA